MPHNGIGSHQSAAMLSDEWLTPPGILSALGGFDLDPCACREPRPWPTASTMISLPDNGIFYPWFGRVWLNPPYGGPTIVGPWLNRMAAHDNGTALIFARTETELFHKAVWPCAHAILFLRGRLHFHRPDGTRAAANAGAPSCLIAYGLADAAILSNCEIPGKLIILK